MIKLSGILIPSAIISILAFNSCAGTPTPAELPPESRLVVAVAALENSPAQDSSSWEEELVTGLLESKRVRVIERARLDALLSENELTMSALGDVSAGPVFLQAIGADAVLFTKVTEIREYSGKTTDAVTGWWDDVSLGIEAKLSARLASATTGEILAAASSSAQAASGTFFGAMGESKIDKDREVLVGEAISEAVAILALEIARKVPEKN